MLGPKEALIHFGIYALVLALSIGLFFLLMKIENDLLQVICVIGYAVLMGYVLRSFSLLRK